MYARGKKAYGFCDRCDFRYPLVELKYEYKNRARTGIRVCPVCFDPDHPQQRLNEWDHSDAIALEDPRPDRGRLASQSLFGFDPVGNLIPIKVAVGKVTTP